MARKRKAGDGTVRQRKDGRWEGRIVIRGPQAQVWNRLRQSDQRPPLRGALLPQVARWQKARPQCLRPHPRGV